MASSCKQRLFRRNSVNLKYLTGLVFVIVVFATQSTTGAGNTADFVDHQAVCQTWTENTNMKNIIDKKITVVTHCPCAEKQIVVDPAWEKRGRCYRQWFYRDGVKQMCCYNYNGMLNTGPPNGGFMILESHEGYIMDSHSSCCNRQHANFCKQYYQVNPSDDCSLFRPPVYETSWGDPHIKTIGGLEYDFNGHGEYIFLKNENFTIQARTDYVVSDNKDVTIFTAFAIKVAGDNVQLILDKESKNLLIYGNSTNICNSTSSPRQPCKFSKFIDILAGENDITIIQSGIFGSVLKMIQVKTSSSLDITLFPGKGSFEHLEGLAGGTLIRNNTTYSNTSTSKDWYNFGESYRITNETDSVFNYSLTPKDFAYYNINQPQPTFLEDLIGNLSALFNHGSHNHSETDINLFKSVCIGNKRCFLAIARSDNIESGRAIMTEIARKKKIYDLTHNQPPKFLEGCPQNIKAKVGVNNTVLINLTACAKDNNTEDVLTFDVDTQIPDSDYTLENGLFNWTITENIRNMSSEVLITFTVSDKYNMTDVYTPSVQYCGCDKPGECSSAHFGDESVKFQEMTCDCGRLSTGTWCEERPPPCLLFNCFEPSKCNNDTKDKIPCAQCPEGYEGNGEQCSDINECKVEKYKECSQQCNNTIGSYECLCASGYNLAADNKTCEDIDECKTLKQPDGPCPRSEQKTCVNTDGSFTCRCLPTYYMENGTCTSSKDAYSYVSGLNIPVPKNTTVDKALVQVQLTALLNETCGFLSVEILTIVFIPGNKPNRRKRGAIYTAHFKIKFMIYSDKQMNETDFQESMQQSIQNQAGKDNIKFSKDVKSFGPVNVGNINQNIPADAICNTTIAHCDPSSTKCRVELGQPVCDCKAGYMKKYDNDNFCLDVDECKSWGNMSTDMCVHGQCFNSPGNWSCLCTNKSRSILKSFGQRYRCEGDYKYIGEMSVTWVKGTYKNESLRNNTKSLIRHIYENSTNATGQLASGHPYSMSDIFVSVEILNTTNMSINDANQQITTLRYLLHIGEPLDVALVANFQQHAFDENILNNTDFTWIVNGTLKMKLFNDSEYNLCKVTGKTSCDLESTECLVSKGSIQCKCKEGFKKFDSIHNINNRCEDKDECTDFVCNNGGTCVNTPGNWTCLCTEGFRSGPNKTCEDIDECKENFICANGNCTNTFNSWQCNCDAGYIKTHDTYTYKFCEDIDECSNSTYEKEHCDCRNTLGNWTCPCLAGYKQTQSTDDKIICEDIDECTELKFTCVRGECMNLPGNWTCQCNDNMYGALKVTGPEEYRCLGNFQYIGEISFTWSEKPFNVSDVKSSIISQMTTLYNSSSVPINGYFMSHIFSNIEVTNVSDSTPKGFERMSKVTVQYIVHLGESLPEEQVAQLNEKLLNSTRRWTYNEITILYNDGKMFKGNETNLCDIPGKTNCDSTSTTCLVTNGTFTCKCRTGFTETTESNQYCKDIDECSDKKHNCNGTCENTLGNWSCTCPKGYTSTWSEYNMTCGNINECLLNTTYQCLKGSCKDTDGSWQCICDQGYNLKRIDENSFTCEDINECNTTTYVYNACLETDNCINLNGSWTCKCRQGIKPTKVNDTTQICGGDYQYVVSLTLVLTRPFQQTDEPELKTFLSEEIRKLYIVDHPDVRVEIVDITQVSSYHKRDTRKLSTELKVYTILHFDLPKTSSDLEIQLKNMAHAFKNDHFTLSVLTNISQSVEKNALCGIPSKNICDRMSTTCKTGNGNISCNCITGYQTIQRSKYSCKEINDCLGKTCRSPVTGVVNCVDGVDSWSCNCSDGYVHLTNKTNNNIGDCVDIDECSNWNTSQHLQVHPVCIGAVGCTNSQGSWKCSCNKWFHAIQVNKTTQECIDTCRNSNCANGKTCYHDDNTDGYKCRCPNGKSGIFCNETETSVNENNDKNDSSLQTILIASGSSLGFTLIVIVLVVVFVRRWRSSILKDIKDEKMSLRTMDNGFTDEGVLNDYYLRNSSFQDRRSNRSFSDDRALKRHSEPVVILDAHQNGFRLPRIENILPRSPKPDYGRPRSPKPDYHQQLDKRPTVSPKPDYMRNGFGRVSDESRDSGMGNGGSLNGDYRKKMSSNPELYDAGRRRSDQYLYSQPHRNSHAF